MLVSLLTKSLMHLKICFLFFYSWNLFGAIGCQLYGFFTYLGACNNIMTYAAISYFRYQIVCENKYSKMILSIDYLILAERL